MTVATLDPVAESLAEAAAHLASRGWRVFPVHSIRARVDDDGRLACTCGNADCASPGKHPVSTRRVVDHATSDPDEVRRLWGVDKKTKQRPRRNIAGATGANSGVVILDVDAGGAAALAELEKRHGALPPTLEARTGTDGRHLVYRHPGVHLPSATIGPRIRGIGDNDYAVLAPSLHVGGGSYAWVNSLAPADLPEAWLKLWSPAPAPKPVVESDPLQRIVGLDPLAAVRGRVTGDDVEPALTALAEHLAFHRVDRTGVIDVVERAGKRASPPVSRARAEYIAGRAVADYAKWLSDFTQSRSAAEKKSKVVDPYTAEGQLALEALERKARRSGEDADPAIAVRVWVDAHMRVLDYDESRRELRLEWLPTGQVLALPPFKALADAQERTGRTIGNFDSFAKRAHPKANGKLVMRVLQDLTAEAETRSRDDAESSSVLLVQAILELDIWLDVEDRDGRVSRRTFMLKNREGFNKEVGLGVDQLAGRPTLFVSATRLANGALSRSSEFRGKTHSELVTLLQGAPGYVGTHRSPGAIRKVTDTQLHAIDLETFDAATSEKERSPFPKTSNSSANHFGNRGESPPDPDPHPPHVGELGESLGNDDSPRSGAISPVNHASGERGESFFST